MLQDSCKTPKKCNGKTCFTFINNCMDHNICLSKRNKVTVRYCRAFRLCLRRSGTNYSVKKEFLCRKKDFFNGLSSKCESKKIRKFNLRLLQDIYCKLLYYFYKFIIHQYLHSYSNMEFLLGLIQ